VGFEKPKSHLVGHSWLLEKKTEQIPKVSENRGGVLLDLYYEKSCFWAKALVAFGPFGWLLAFTKTKTGSKAQPKGPLFSSQVCAFLSY